jgi:hypothetical protein
MSENPALGSGRVVAKVARRFEHEARDIDTWTRDEADNLLEQGRRLEPAVYPALLCASHTGRAAAPSSGFSRSSGTHPRS